MRTTASNSTALPSSLVALTCTVRGVEPRLIAGDLAWRLAQIDRAGAAKSDLGADAFGHAVPLAQAFDRQRNLREVAPLGPAKPPIARGLLARQLALLHQDRRVRQQRRQAVERDGGR